MNEKRISRRAMLFAGASVAALPLSLLGDQVGTPTSQPPLYETNDRKLEIIPAQHQKFSDEVEKLFPGLQSDPKFQMIAPLACLIKHERGPALRAYVMTWRVTAPGGKYATALYRYAHPGSKLKRRKDGELQKGRTAASAQVNLIGEGQARLVTPFFTISPKSYNKSNSDWYKKVIPKEPAGFLSSELASATDVQVGMDAAIFCDRQLLGHDQFQFAARLSAIRNAEHDEATAILKLIKSEASDSVLTQALNEHGTVAILRAGKRRVAYQQAKRRYAQHLLNLMSGISRDRFIKVLQRTSRMHKTVLQSTKA